MTVRALPHLRFKDPETQRAYDSIREALQEGNGERGDPNNRWLTVGDALEGKVTQYVQSGTTPIVVPPPDPGDTQTVVVLTVSTPNPAVDAPFTLTASVVGTTPTGTVVFKQDGATIGSAVTLAGGIAPYSLSLPKGTYQFVAEYSGDNNNPAATSPTLQVTVGAMGTEPVQATVVLVIDPAKPKSSQLFSLTAVVSGNNPTGTIQFRQDGDLMTLDPVTLVDAVAVLGSLDRPKGTYTFVAEYSGDANNLPAVSNTLTVEVGSVWDGPPDSVTDLVTINGIGYIVVAWRMPYIGDMDVVEIWGSVTNDRATATKLGESNGSMFVYVPPENQPTWYFWVRVRDSEGLFSDYYPNTTTGVVGTALSLEDEIADTPLWNDLGTRLDGLDAEIASQIALLQGQIDEVLGAPDYDPATTYQTGDIVKYSGSLYRAKQTTTGNLPTNTTYWEHIGDYASLGEAVAAHTSQISMLVTDLSAEVSARETLAARVTTAEGDIATQAGYINNRYTKAETDSAVASAVTGVIASYQAADTTNLNAAKSYSDAAVTSEATARASADSALSSQINTVSAVAGAKNRTYRQTTAPTSGMVAGDLWFDSDDNNKAYRYDGTNWVATDDARISGNVAAIQTETTARANADSALASQITTLQSSVNGNTALLQTQGTVIDGLKAQYMVKTDVNGLVAGYGLYNNGATSDFIVRVDRFAIGNPSTPDSGYQNDPNIPFIVYTTPQTITSPDGRTLTVAPGVYIKTANIQKAFIGDAEFYGHLKSYSWPTTNGVPDSAPGSFPFSGWILDKSNSNPTLKIYGGGFGMWDQWGTPIITAGKINFNQFRRLILTGGAEAFVVGPSPANTITPSTITLRARAQNLAGTISLTPDPLTYNGTFTNVTVSTDGIANFTISPANFTSSVATFTAAMTVDGVVYNDTITIAKVQEGSNAILMTMDNENDSVTTGAAGSISGTITLSTNVRVLRGSKNVLYGAFAETGWNVSYVVTANGSDSAVLTGTNTLNGTTFAFNASTGLLTVGMTSASYDRILIAVTAIKGSETVSKTMTVTKQKQGATGANAKSVSLQVSGFVRTRAKDGTITPGVLYITPNGSNLAGSPLLCYTYASPPPPLTAAPAPGADGNTTWAGWITSLGAKLRVNANATTAPSDSIIADGWWDLSKPKMAIGVWWDGLSDVVSLSEVTEGSDGLTVVLTNEAHVIPAANDGSTTAGSYTGSGTFVYVYEGSTLLAANTAAQYAAGVVGFTIGTLTGTSITPGAVSYGALYSGQGIIGAHSAMTQDTASVSIPITVRRLNGQVSTITRTQTLSKSKQGAAGSSAVTMVLSNESHTLPCTANGTITSTTGASCTATVYEGSTDTTTSPTPAWVFTTTASSGVSYSGANTRSVQITGMTVDAGYIDITATKGSTSIVKRFSISKSKTGHTLSLSTTAQVIKGNSAVANVNVPPQFTITAATTGSVSNLIWEYSNSQTATPSWTSAGSLGASWTLGSGAGDGVAHFPEYNSIFLVRVTDTGTGISDVMTISRVVDGAQGPTGPTGQTGTRGSVFATITDTVWNANTSPGKAWDAIVAVARTSTPVYGDYVFLNSESSPVYAYNSPANATRPGTWVQTSQQFHGAVLFPGSVTANQIKANSITADRLAIGVTGKNLIHNSGPTRGGETNGWTTAGPYGGLTASVGAGSSPWQPLDTGSVYVTLAGTPSINTIFELLSTRKIPVIPGQSYELSAYLSLHRCTGYVFVTWYNASNISVGTSSGTTQSIQLAQGDVSTWPRSSNLTVTAPGSAAYAVVGCRGASDGTANPSLFATHLYFGEKAFNQSVLSPWAPALFQTVIDGAGIRTGSITAESAVIADGAITNAKIGNSIASTVAGSPTFNADGSLASVGTEGWGAGKLGDAVFNRVIVRSGAQIGNNATVSIGNLSSAATEFVSAGATSSEMNIGTYTFRTPVNKTRGLFISLDMDASLNAKTIKVLVYSTSGTPLGYYDAYYKADQRLDSRFFSGNYSWYVNTSLTAWVFKVQVIMVSSGGGTIGNCRLNLLEVTG